MRARDNPFRTERLERLAFRHDAMSIDDIHARWLALGRRGAVVGPHGSGKTTLLRALAARAARDGFRVHRWFRNAESPPPRVLALLREARALDAGDVLLFDGAGHLPRWAWRCVERATRGAGGLVVTAHAPGLLPALVETRTDAALLDGLLAELVGDEQSRWRAVAAPLYERCAGNVRDVFLALYDVAACGDPRPAAQLPRDGNARTLPRRRP